MSRAVVAAMVALMAGGCRPVGAPTPPAAPASVDDPVRAEAPRGEGVPLPSPAAPAPPADGSTAPCPAGPLQSLLETANLVRTDRGLPALHPEGRLAAAARAHARDLVEHDIRGHRGSDGSLPGDRATRAGYAWTVVGENVAAGYTGASAVVSGWMASPPHRENLLAPEFREVGLARVEAPPHMGPVWVMLLGRRADVPVAPPGCVG